MTERRRHTTTGGFPGPFDIRIHRVCSSCEFELLLSSSFRALGLGVPRLRMESGIVDHLFSFEVSLESWTNGKRARE